jgi:serine/threonine protein kinase
MTADLGQATAAAPQPGTQVGDYTLGSPLWQLAAADVYRATGPAGAAAVFVVRPEISQLPDARDAVLAAARAAAGLAEERHLVRTLGAGVDGGVLWVATEELDGSLVRDLLARKREAGAGGFGARGAGNLVIGAAAGLAAAHTQHGALSTESIIVNRQGRVRVIDLPLGPGVVAAVAAGRLPAVSHHAPERAVSPSADVYGLGALLYEVLVGRPLERGGPRPSEVVGGLTGTVDELIARMCARDPERRFGSVEVVKEIVAEALGRGGAVAEAAVPAASSLGAASDPGMTAPPSLATALSQPGIVPPPADPALASALADSNEKWLIAKGRLDYGPFSLADVVDQIKSHEIVTGNVIVDKDTGERCPVEDHPLLGAIVDHARQAKDDARRAEAEVAHQTREKTRGFVLYAVIGLGVLGVALGVWLIVKHTGAAKDRRLAGIDSVGGAKLAVKISPPKAPPRRHHSGGGHHRGGGTQAGGGDESLALDMSGGDDDDSERLDMGTVYKVYSAYGGRLGGCLQSTHSRSASVAIIIAGHTGKVTYVKVNGQQSGSLFACVNRVMRSMTFPTVNGPRTRAEFDLSL